MYGRFVPVSVIYLWFINFFLVFFLYLSVVVGIERRKRKQEIRAARHEGSWESDKKIVKIDECSNVFIRG